MLVETALNATSFGGGEGSLGKKFNLSSRNVFY